MERRETEHEDERPSDDVVRPRLVWGGLLLSVAGLVTCGVGIMALDRTTSIIGAAALVLGAGAMWFGGVMNDVSGQANLRAEADAAVHGDARDGHSPQIPQRPPRLERRARIANQDTRRRLQAAEDEKGPALAPVAGWTIVLAAALLFLAQAVAVPLTPAGRTSSVRDTLLAVALAVPGLRIAVGSGRHLISSIAAVALGAVLVLVGLTARHDSPTLAVLEAALGVIAVLAAVAAQASPRTLRQRPSA